MVTLTWPTWTYYVLVPIGAGLAVLRSVVNLVSGPTEPAVTEPDGTQGAEAI